MTKTQLEDSIGKKFSHLTVLGKGIQYHPSRVSLNVQCDCGTIKTVLLRSLLSGGTRTCGQCDLHYKLPRNIGNTNLSDDIKNRLLKTAYSKIKSSAKGRNIDFELSLEIIIKLIQLSCFACGDQWSSYVTQRYKGERYTLYYNGLDRINNNLGYTANNVITLCKPCNRIKNDQNLEDMLRRAEGLLKLGKKWLKEGYQ